MRRESWHRLRRAPYGYPHSLPDKATIFAPAHYPARLITHLRGLYEAAPPSLQQKVTSSANDLDAQIKIFYDLVAIHEGHLFIHHLQLSLGTHWLTELVANLFATAFFVEKRPDLASKWLAWAQIQANAEVSYHSLVDYEKHYTTLDFTNANYYQGRLAFPASQIWLQKGPHIANALIEQFSLTPKAISTRFRQVVPGTLVDALMIHKTRPSVSRWPRAKAGEWKRRKGKSSSRIGYEVQELLIPPQVWQSLIHRSQG